MNSPPFTADPKTRDLERAEIEEKLIAGASKTVMSEWPSLVFYVPTKDGKHRFCVNQMNLNMITIKETYPLRQVDECIYAIGEVQHFSTLEA